MSRLIGRIRHKKAKSLVKNEHGNREMIQGHTLNMASLPRLQAGRETFALKWHGQGRRARQDALRLDGQDARPGCLARAQRQTRFGGEAYRQEIIAPVKPATGS